MKTLKQLKKDNNKTNKLNTILFALLVVITISFSVGYSLLNQNLSISGEAVYRVQEDIRITRLEKSEIKNGAYEDYNSKYSKNTIKVGLTLPSVDSEISYKVTVTNCGNIAMIIDSIENTLYSNENITYTLSEALPINVDGITSNINTQKDIIIAFKYNVETLPENKTLEATLTFGFKEAVKPILAKGSSGGSSSSKFFNGPIAKSKVETITFSDTIDVGENYWWDASEAGDDSVIAWYTDLDENGYYEVTIGGEGGVVANSDSSYLFYYFNKLTSINFNDSFDTSSVTNMSSMFYLCQNLTSLDVSGFNTSNVTNMSGMFYACNELTSLDVSNFNTSNVTDMSKMFYACNELTSLDVSNFNTSNVTDMSRMFSGYKLVDIYFGGNFNTSNVTNMSSMFIYCEDLTSLNVSGFDTSNVTNMNGMFHGCVSLMSLNLSSFDTSNVTDMSKMFYNCDGLTSLDLSDFDTSNVTDMSKMFYYSERLTNINLSGFDTSNLINMSEMFYYCIGLVNLDLSNFNFNNVESYSNIFYASNKNIKIIVKDETAQAWVIARNSNFTTDNVIIANS